MGNSVLCSLEESQKIIASANNYKQRLLNELKPFINFNLDIEIYKKQYPMGYGIGARIISDGEVLKEYSIYEECFLDINELLMKLLNKQTL